MNDILIEDTLADGNIPEAYRSVQAMLDRFVEINYEVGIWAAEYNPVGSDIDAEYCRQRIWDIVRNNPPLMTVPKSLRKSLTNNLWYSDFYDDVPKDVLRQYGSFTPTDTKITPANYATELAKIDLPYFKELVNIVGLEKLRQLAEKNNPPEVSNDLIPKEPESQQSDVKPTLGERRLSSPTRSYESKMSEEQLSLLAEGLNTLGVFVENITAPQLTDLLAGKQPRLFHVANQRKLTYLFDELRDGGYVTRTWIAVAGQNCDFASVNPRQSDSGIHFITSQQFTNCRRANRSQAIPGLNTIDDMMEQMQQA